MLCYSFLFIYVRRVIYGFDKLFDVNYCNEWWLWINDLFVFDVNSEKKKSK